MRERKRILVLGGTSEARRAASALDKAGFAVVTSLAGVTENPLLPTGEVRSGGFGGADGLAEYLEAGKFTALVDATHPFAATITRNGFEAAEKAKLPYVRLERRPWKPLEGERWQVVADMEAAAKAIKPGATALLTTGRKGLTAFLERDDISVVARSIEPPSFKPPENWTFVIARPPFSVESEMALMKEFGIDVLVTKNSGGKAVSAKLQAARSLGIRVIMIDRPLMPDIRKVRTIDQMLKYLPRA